MGKTYVLGVLSTVFLLFGCQDPIFWVQVAEGNTPQHNLTKNAMVFDADATATNLYAIMGGWLYTRSRNQVTWRQINLGGRRAYSIDVVKGKIGMFDNVYDIDLVTGVLSNPASPERPMVFFDKVTNTEISQTQSDSFDSNGQPYPGRYLGMIGSHIVSTVAVFNSSVAPVNPSVWLNPRATYRGWLIAGSDTNSNIPVSVGITSGDNFDNPNPLAVSAARSVVNEGFIVRRGAVSETLVLIGITSGYRELFLDSGGNYAIREPLTSVNDVNTYRASKMTEASVERFVFRNGVLFALTSNMGLWSMENGKWTWE